MVEVGARDALQPALLDRLTDHDPTRKVEGRDERVLSRAQLRASVLRDLSWLFNSTNLASTVDLSAHPLAAQSTLNYGLTALAGNAVAGLEFAEVEQILKDATFASSRRISRRPRPCGGFRPKERMGTPTFWRSRFRASSGPKPTPVS